MFLAIGSFFNGDIPLIPLTTKIAISPFFTKAIVKVAEPDDKLVVVDTTFVVEGAVPPMLADADYMCCKRLSKIIFLKTSVR